MLIFTIIGWVIAVIGIVAAIVNTFKENESVNNTENDAAEFAKQMRTEYQRGVKSAQSQIDQLNVTLEKMYKEKTEAKKKQDDLDKSWRDVVAQLEKDKEIAETERDQYVHQIEDLVEEQKQLHDRIAKLTTRKSQLKQQIEDIKENHGYDLLDHGNTIREETLNKILGEIETFVESKKRRIEPTNQSKQPIFQIKATGTLLPPYSNTAVNVISESSGNWQAPSFPSGFSLWQNNPDEK